MSLKEIPPNSLRLPWLQHGKHFVHATVNLGYLAVQTAVEYVSSGWQIGSIDLDTYCQLRPRGDLWQYPGAILKELKLRDTVNLDLQAGKETEYLHFLEPSTTHAEFMTSREMVSWWHEHALPQGLTSAEFCLELQHAHFLTRTGYSQLGIQSESADRDSANVRACLSMVGAGALIAMFAKPCCNCNFRREVFGKLRCRFCSRSKAVVDPSNEPIRAAEVKRADRVKRSFHAVPNFDFSVLGETFNRTIAALLFEMMPGVDAHTKWRQKIQAALDEAPLVRCQLPVDFSQLGFHSQTSALQAVIDPVEWDYASWPEKIALAQTWCQGSKDLKSRRRGPGPMPTTLERAREAMRLIRLGKTKTETAVELGITASNLSHLLHRTEGHR